MDFAMKGLKRIVALFAVTALLSGCTQRPYESETLNQLAADYRAKREAGLPLAITRLDVTSPNSAGGVSVRFNAANLSGKVIKYLRLTAVAHNSVGDRERGEISRSSTAQLRVVGPIQGGNDNSYFENVWYNHVISCVEISRIRIEYMDGSAATYSGPSQVNQLFNPRVSNNCG